MLQWWQDRCLEWCYAREEGGKFGDQKYLDEWPELFRDEVHVLRQTEKTLAPWNVAHTSRIYGAVAPVFFHFHSLKVYKPNKVRLFSTYYIGDENMWIYERDLSTFRAAVDLMRCTGIAIRTSALPREPLYWIRRPKWWLEGRLRYTWV